MPGVRYSLHLRVEDEKCDLHCRTCEAHVCVGSLSSCLNRLSSSLSTLPPPPTPSYLPPVETILTMCVAACAKCARFLFPEIAPIWKQLQISAWNKLTSNFEKYKQASKLWDSKEDLWSRKLNGVETMEEHVLNQVVCKTFTARQSPRTAPIVGWGFSLKGGWKGAN